MTTDPPTDDPYRTHLDLIERVIDFVRRRKGLGEDEAEEFASHVHQKLLEDDRAVLRKFEGKSRLQTYLTTVILRLLLDWRTAKWGKWRPSAAARRLGPMAVHLERLTTRDGFSFDEACRILRQNHQAELTDDELEAMAAQLPARTTRRPEGEERLSELPAPGEAPEETVLEDEREDRKHRAEEALARALAALGAEDRLILQMRYQDDFKIADIARALHLPQKPLYRRLERLLRALRRTLEGLGFSAEEITDLLRPRRF